MSFTDLPIIPAARSELPSYAFTMAARLGTCGRSAWGKRPPYVSFTLSPLPFIFSFLLLPHCPSPVSFFISLYLFFFLSKSGSSPWILALLAEPKMQSASESFALQSVPVHDYEPTT